MPIHEHILDTHEQRAGDALQRLMAAYNSGAINYTSELLDMAAKEYSEFYSTLGKPTMKARVMRVGDLLRVSDVQAPLEELDADLKVGFRQADRLRDSVKSSINLCAVERASLNTLYSRLQSKVNELTHWTNDSQDDFQWASDTFNHDSSIDTSVTNAWWNPVGGCIQLPIVSEAVLNGKVSRLAVQQPADGSDGVAGALPGNNFEVSTIGYPANADMTTTPLNPTYVRAGYCDSKNLANINDGDPTTWFEWEKYYVPQTQRLKKYGADSQGAWVYGGGVGDIQTVLTKSGDGAESLTKNYGWTGMVRWPGQADAKGPYRLVETWQGETQPSGGLLDLTIVAEFESPQDLNWIELTPYLTSSRIVSVQVLPEGGTQNWVELLERPIILNPKLDSPLNKQEEGIFTKDVKGIAVIPCHLPGKVTSVRVTIGQGTAYETIIAHQFFVKTTKEDWSHWHLFKKDSGTTISYNRVANESVLSNEGYSEKGNIAGNLVGAGAGYLALGAVAGPVGWLAAGIGAMMGGNLFGAKHNVTDQGTAEYYDVFKAYRAVIGVRDLGLYQRVYSNTAKFQSRPQLFSKPVKTVSLIVGEVIPETWPNDTKWITYQVSADGSVWKNIVPQRVDLEDSVVEFDTPTTSIYLRAILRRPDNKPNETSTITYYALKTTQGSN